jgi:hypothetical protein
MFEPNFYRATVLHVESSLRGGLERTASAEAQADYHLQRLTRQANLRTVPGVRELFRSTAVGIGASRLSA